MLTPRQCIGTTLAAIGVITGNGGAVSGGGNLIGGCDLFPAGNIWNTPVDALPVDPWSNDYVNTIGPTKGLHPDFGTVYEGAPNGIPFVIVPVDQPMVEVSFYWWDESDPGPYPIPPDAPIEGGSDSDGDRHVLIVREGECKLYELYRAFPQTDGTWQADSGAIYDLAANALRPDTWTSADAAGLPMLPGLVTYEEVESGEITHALRFTCNLTRKAHLWPARHDASSSMSLLRPPMGQRFRLKADFDISPYPPHVRVILTALKKYGMILADNGGDWFISGAPNSSWDDDELATISGVKGMSFEAVDASSLQVDPDSAKAKPCAPGDANADHTVGIDDLLDVVNQWGACDHCPADLAPEDGGDGAVNVDDLLTVVNTWGPCE